MGTYLMNKNIKAVYIAGALSPINLHSKHPSIDYLGNVRQMIRIALDVFFAGYDPFVPAFDLFFFLMRNDDKIITESMIKRYSKEWLKRSDALILINGWRKSRGTIGEIKLANQLSIPVFRGLDKLDSNSPSLIDAETCLEELKK